MWHAFWLPKPPGGCNVRAHNPDGSKPDTCARECRRPSSDIDARAHPTVEQDAQAASAALLEGEEKRTPSVSSEQAAAPGTPSTFDSPSLPLTATPANLEATPQPRSHIRTRAHNPSRIAHDIQTGRVVHPGTSPPHLAPGLQAPGAFAEDPDEAGGVTTAEGGARHPLEDVGGTASTFAARDRRRRRARPPHGCRGTAQPHRSRRTSTPYPPPLSTDQVPDAQGYPITRMARPVAQGAERAASTTSTPMRWPVSQQTPGSLTRRPPCRPLGHTLFARATCVSRAPTRAAHWTAIQARPAA